MESKTLKQGYAPNDGVKSRQHMHLFYCVSGLAHDAVLLWAYGVNKTLEQGYAPNDGVRVTTNVFILLCFRIGP